MTSSRLLPLGALLAALVALVASACADPVASAQIDALPPDGIRNGPTHRGGQPCTLCHSAHGGQTPHFSLAGTVYQKPTSKIPIENAVVHVTEATGATMDLTTNCAGNFYVADTQWSPAFPIFIDLSADGLRATMHSKIGRDSSCASCHADPAGQDTVGHVYLTSDPTVPDMAAPALDCGRGGVGGG